MFRNTFTSYDNQILADSSIDYYLSIQRSGTDLGIELLGYLWLMSDRQLRANAKNIDRMSKNCIDLKNYPREELLHSIPSLRMGFESSDLEASTMGLESIESGLFGAKCGKLEPDKLSKFYYDRFVALGGYCRFDTRATGLILEPKKKLDVDGEPFVWQENRIAGVQTRGSLEGTILAETVVLAAGAWSNLLLEPIGLDGHAKSKKRQIFRVSAGANKELSELLRSGSFNGLGIVPFTILPRCAIYLKPVAAGEQFWIGCDDDIGRQFIDSPEFDPSCYTAEATFYEKEVYPVLTAYYPAFQQVSPSGMWAGLIAYNTIDFLPLVFEYENLIVVGGDSGSGIMKADALGRIVNSLYCCGTASDAELYGGAHYRVSKLSIEKRQVEREEWVL